MSCKFHQLYKLKTKLERKVHTHPSSKEKKIYRKSLLEIDKQIMDHVKRGVDHDCCLEACEFCEIRQLFKKRIDK